MTSEAGMTVELMPCPFCGSPAFFCPDDSNGGCGVGCSKACDAEPYCSAVIGDPRAAITAWNTRAPSPDMSAKPQNANTSAGHVERFIERVARQALFGCDLARTDVVWPVNGSAAYSYVVFQGQRVEFTDRQFTLEQHRDAGTAQAAAYAVRINNTLFDLAKRAADIALRSAPASPAAPDGYVLVPVEGYPIATDTALAERLRAMVSGDGRRIVCNDRTTKMMADDILAAAAILSAIPAPDAERLEA